MRRYLLAHTRSARIVPSFRGVSARAATFTAYARCTSLRLRRYALFCRASCTFNIALSCRDSEHLCAPFLLTRLVYRRGGIVGISDGNKQTGENGGHAAAK